MATPVKAISVDSLGLSGELAEQIRTIAAQSGGPDLDTVEELQQAGAALQKMESGIIRARLAIGLGATTATKAIVMEGTELYEYTATTVEEGVGCAGTVEYPAIERKNLATGKTRVINQWLEGCAARISGQISKLVTDGQRVFAFFKEPGWIGEVVLNEERKLAIGFIRECAFPLGCGFVSINVKITDLRIEGNRPVAVLENLESGQKETVPLNGIAASSRFNSCGHP